MPIHAEILDAAPLLSEWRRTIHANPEAGFEEVETARFVAEKLTAWGIEVHEGIGGTGVVGVIRGDRPGPMIGLRAELDALVMREEGDVPHRSRRPDRFHGCGHDGHTTMLLGAAQYLAAHRTFAGTVVLVFQPAEETLRGVAAMLADGLLERFPIEEVYALHNMPSLPKGTISVRKGAILSACDAFSITIRGVGGHGAAPQDCIDPIVVGAALVQGLQTIVSRSIDPLETAVISAGMFQAGTSPNVIPGEATLAGTIRTFSPAVRDITVARMRAICDGIALQYGASITCEVDGRCPPTVNDPRAVAVVVSAATDVIGAERVNGDVAPAMPSEDFSFLLARLPGAFAFLGQDGAMCHHPEFDFDDTIAPIGTSVFVRIVELRLA